MSARQFGALALGSLLVAGCTSTTRSASPPASVSGSTAATSSVAGRSGSLTSSPAGASSGTASHASSGTGSVAPSSPGGTAIGRAGGPVPAGFVPYSATFIDADQVWVLGNAPCSKAPCSSLIHSGDGGKSWQRVPVPRAPVSQALGRSAGQVSSVRFANESDGWVAGGLLFATHDGGRSWHKVQVGPSGGVITAVGAAAGWAYAARSSCAVQAGCTATTTVYSTAVGSDRWSAVSAPLGDASSALVVSGSRWYVATPAGIYSGQGSGTAVRIANPCRSGPMGATATPTLAVADARHLDATCDGGAAAGSSRQQLYGTSDGGRHWIKAGPARWEPSGLYGMADNGRGVLLAAVASGDDEILRTVDDGATVGAVKTLDAGGLPWADLGFTTPTQAMAVLVNRAMFLSHDSGRTWTQVRF